MMESQPKISAIVSNVIFLMVRLHCVTLSDFMRANECAQCRAQRNRVLTSPVELPRPVTGCQTLVQQVAAPKMEDLRLLHATKKVPESGTAVSLN